MITRLHDAARIYEHLQKDRSLFAYHIGDLATRPWDCTWYGFIEDEAVSDVVLVWHGTSTPVVCALGLTSAMPQLVDAVMKNLPDRFYCHYQKALEPLFLASYKRIVHVHALKMDFHGLPSNLFVAENQPCIPLTMEDLQPLQQLLQIASPNNAFHPRMLATGKFYGIKQGDNILSVAGVHIYAPTYRIALVGNIATHPSMRHHGLATQCMTALLKALEPDVDFIGLITRTDNAPAIALYQRTGFSIASTLEEALFERH